MLGESPTSNPRTPGGQETRPIRVGIVGCGNVMDGAYMPALEKLHMRPGGVDVRAACHDDVQKAQPILRKWHIPTFIADYHDLVQSPEVDLVLILTSMPQHAPIARAALEAGKHVLVEKPLATSLADARELMELAKRSPGYLVCAPFVILSPTFRKIWNRIQQGDIGKVLNARARYGWSGPDWADWFYRPGGGCLFDLGVYNLTSLTGLLGPAKQVMAMTGTAIPKRVVRGERIRVAAVDNAQVLLDFGASVFAVVTTGFTIQKYRGPALELYGSEGTLQMLGDDWGPEGYELWRNQVGAWQVFEETDRFWSWTDGLRHLVECIQKKSRPLVTPEHAYHVLEIMIAAEESGRDRCAKPIQSTFPLPALAEEAGAEAPAHRIHDRTREET